MIIKWERYLAKIRPFYDVDLIKVLTGVRRCGKSVLLSQIEEELRSDGYDEEHLLRAATLRCFQGKWQHCWLADV